MKSVFRAVEAVGAAPFEEAVRMMPYRRLALPGSLALFGLVALSLGRLTAQIPSRPDRLPEQIAAPREQIPEPPRPGVLDRPLSSPTDRPSGPSSDPTTAWQSPIDAPTGFSGPSSVEPSEGTGHADFIPREDRWRIGYPEWDRYNRGHPKQDDYPFDLGHLLDPYHQNVLKGDYPIIGQHTFLNITATTTMLNEPRQLPTATTPFESTIRPFQEEFFGNPNQYLYSQFFFLSFDLSQGDAAFKPADWRIKITPAFNVNYLTASELAVVSPNVNQGLSRGRSFIALQEWFGELKLADLSSDYDFVSVRAGSQFFQSDFRGFLFSDTNRAVRLFGTAFSNRDQFNLVWFNQLEKDTNSTLNTMRDRDQNIFIANYYRQDFIFPGYTMEASVHVNNDQPSIKYDKNGFLVRPDPVGVFQPHRVTACYLGLAGDGHIDRININHTFYWALGEDSRNPIANAPQTINAFFGAAEVSYDRDWARFRVSALYASGDGNANNGTATGFDGILDNPNFAGSEFNYFARQNIPLFGVQLTNRQSWFPDLRASKIQGQSNFVNPGLWLVNGGVDFDITPKLKMINNASFLWFDKTNVLETFLFDGNIDREIGTDLSVGFEYRPLLSNNVIFLAGFATLIPANGFRDLYDRLNGQVNPLYAAFVEMVLTF